MEPILFMGIVIGNGEFNSIFEFEETHINVQFIDEGLKQFDGQCLVIRHSDQSILVYDNKGEKLFESEIINIPYFRQELLKKLTD